MMKNTYLRALLIVLVCVAVGLNFYYQAKTQKISDAVIANVDALANGEGLGSVLGPQSVFMCGISDGYKDCWRPIIVCMGKDETDCEGMVCERHNT